MRLRWLVPPALVLLAAPALLHPWAPPAGRTKEPAFILHQIGNDHSEGITVFDFDRDGVLDVTSGAYWYKGPTWTRQEFREAKVQGEFVVNCGEFALDVNQDGHQDILAAGWQEDGIFYFENPRTPNTPWTKVKVTDSRDTEGLISVDVDGDGVKDILPSHYSEQPVWWLQVRRDGFTKRPVGPRGNGHGVGFGDVDGDGKNDILTQRGWHRQVDLANDQWEYQADWDTGLAGIAMHVMDLNQDGLPDVLYGRGHDYGLYWMEQRRTTAGARTWVTHTIDRSYSQIHNIKLVDLDGDGMPELLAGKRYRGHNEKDPGSFDPLAIYYYTIELGTPGPSGQRPRFSRHTLAYNGIVGAGTQFVVADIDKDGDPDIACAGKTGQYWFENLAINNVPWKERELLFNRYPVAK